MPSWQPRASARTVNIALFVALVLVFIIIFIVIAPLGAIDVPSGLPPISNAQPRSDEPVVLTTSDPQPQSGEHIALTLKADRSLWLAWQQDGRWQGNRMVAREDIATALDAVSNGKRDKRIFLRADPGLSYDHILKTLDSLRAAGYLKVGLVRPLPNNGK
jgi:biopolymer transport protein ExbD